MSKSFVEPLEDGEAVDGTAEERGELRKSLLHEQEELVVTPTGSNSSLVSSMSEKISEVKNINCN